MNLPTKDLPTGTVTFLFSDIEGSTRILQESGDAYAGLLEAHAAIIRAEVSACAGMEVSTEGDAFFCVFTSAPAAARAAAAVQRALGAHPWPADHPVRVRIGLHTGEGRLGGDNYAGIDVHRAARVAAAGHGGQVLLTGAVHELIAGTLPDGITVRDLGRHRLKDLAVPEHLFQLMGPGLPSTFPALQSIDARPNNLPADVTSFVGREVETAAVVELLRSQRLVTLTGPGGTGKTRLSRRVAWEALATFEDGAWFVDLSPLSDPALVVSAIGQALDVRERLGEPLIAMLKEHISGRCLLLVLDNFEQVVEAAPIVAELLAAAPRLFVLVTSRVPLHLYGEQEYPVPPLAVPEVPSAAPANGSAAAAATALDLEAFVATDAIRLFVERARAARPDFRLDEVDAPWVAAICARLDGLPLAIELAAARVKLLPPRALMERLDRSLSLLASTASDLPPRQRTLRGAIDWSYDLLDEPDRELFARLAVFVGGFTLPMAEEVVGGPLDGRTEVDALTGVESLLDKSLLRASQVDHEGDVRLQMLETIREYAGERLEASGSRPLLRERHAQAFLALALRAEPELTGPDLATWLDRLGHEHDNLRAALRWSLETGDVPAGLRLGAAVWRFWQQRGHLQEGREWLTELLAGASDGVDPRLRARALIAAGGLAYWQRDYGTAQRWFQESQKDAERADDIRGVAEAIYNLGWIKAVRQENEAAVRLWTESQDISRALGDEMAVARAAQYIGFGTFAAGEMEPAIAAFEEARGYFEAAGRWFEVGDASVGIGQAQAEQGWLGAARREFERALTIFAEAGNLTGIAMGLQGISVVSLLAGEVEAAVRMGAAADRLEEQLGGGAPRTLAPYFFGATERDAARGTIGIDRFEKLWREGRALGVEGMIELVRATPPPLDGPSAVVVESRRR